MVSIISAAVKRTIVRLDVEHHTVSPVDSNLVVEMEHWLWMILAALFFGQTENTSCFYHLLHRVTLDTWYLPLSSPLSLVNNVALMASSSSSPLLFPGPTAGDKISPVQGKVSGREGQSVTLSCNYETTERSIYLQWYKHHSDHQAPQFLLSKGAKGLTFENIPDKRYGSTTSDTSSELIMKRVTLEDSALYYCAVRPTVTANTTTLYKNLWSKDNTITTTSTGGRHSLLNWSSLMFKFDGPISSLACETWLWLWHQFSWLSRRNLLVHWKEDVKRNL